MFDMITICLKGIFSRTQHYTYMPKGIFIKKYELLCLILNFKERD